MRVGKPGLNELGGLLLLWTAAPLLMGQQGGFIAGVVRERSGALVAGAEVRIQSEFTGARQKTNCDAEGKYVSSELAAGDYKVTVRNEGFRTVSETGIRVEAGQTREADFLIDLLPLAQEVTVESARDNSDPTANGLAVSRESSANSLPMNGRDLHGLYGLMPGAAATPAAASDGGQFTVTGQRPNTNTFRIDGISGNTGIGISALPGTFPGSSLPGMTVIGSTQSLASKEEIQRVEMRSSDFAPEYGDRPGAQVLIETRSGSNDLHGSAFGYLRPQMFDSRDWFAQKYKTALAPASLNGYGASLGGAVWPNRTFFFAAFEQVNVNDTALQLVPTPSLAARQAAPADYQVLLNAFPLPVGPQVSPNESLGTVALGKQAGVKNYSGRVDQTIGNSARVFARYANVPSCSTTQELGITDARFGWMSATLGSTFERKGAIQDLRFNYSFVRAGWSWAAGNDREGTALAAFSTAEPYFTPDNVVTALSIAGIGQVLSGHQGDGVQRQWEAAYTAAKQFGRHDVRAGADFIELFPRTLSADVPTVSVAAESVEGVLAGDALGVTLSSGRLVGASGRIPIGSTFVQDTYKRGDRLTILYGVRWEITHPSDSGYSTSLDFGTWNGAGTNFNRIASVYDINPIRWPMRYGQVAPRLGLAYRANAPALVFRLGAGIFYDDALGSLINPVNLSPLNSWIFVPHDINPNSVAPTTALPDAPPLFLPKVWEWRASVERAMGEKSALSLSYVGSAGRRLLREQATLAPGSQILQAFAFTSTGTSDYDALVAQFRGQITPSLYTLVSYTWGHSIDTGSQDSSIFLTGPDYGNAADRGSSSFDIRHNVSASATYRLPGSHLRGSRWLSGWNLSSTMEARTGFPFDVAAVDRSIGLGFADSGRPNLLLGVPLWIQNREVPGGRELNAAAFEAAMGASNGTLGRNVLTGPGLFQVDASLRKQFRVRGASFLEVNASAFNLFNHANFSNPVGYLGSALFGQPVSMQSLMLGSGGPNSGLTPIFQAGGPRTAELSLKFSF